MGGDGFVEQGLVNSGPFGKGGEGRFEGGRLQNEEMTKSKEYFSGGVYHEKLIFEFIKGAH